ncbi:hypothetical protein [Paenibacillus rubinfantis]|uniref:hypothetical protein n=1 Tax=Paenibacillus rubinfantis TaxID=1720296 RepID=UPI00073F8745|nr:hypothetical protein [Paenibacillus rubinfantis]
MKKFISGLIVGLLLFAGTTVFADSAKSLLGKKVQGTFEVAFNGNQIGDAAVIDGSTYLPVRSISDAAGINIAVEGKKIILTTSGSQIVPDVTDAETDAKNKANGDISARIGILKNNIKTNETNIQIERDEVIAPLQKKLAELKAADDGTDVSKQGIEIVEGKISDSQKLIAELQAKIDAADAEIKQLEAQLNK